MSVECKMFLEYSDPMNMWSCGCTLQKLQFDFNDDDDEDLQPLFHDKNGRQLLPRGLAGFRRFFQNPCIAHALQPPLTYSDPKNLGHAVQALRLAWEAWHWETTCEACCL
mmetsp:Transcript_131303/g.241556  ORF Transcript_131303/g.241556 Transcript_131303/m.241556 type:complete len:110 (+) Transcript_131303:2-331(+)